MLKLMGGLSPVLTDTLHVEASARASKHVENSFVRRASQPRPDGRSRATLPSVNLRIEPAPGQESVWDDPRPPPVEPVPELIRVVVSGVDIAASAAALRVLETAGPPVYYLPPADVRLDLLAPT